MSEYDQHEEERRKHSIAPEATVHVAWSPWVWIVPALAVFIAGFLVVRYGFFGGGDITVRFQDARGLDRYSPVRFRGAKVGTVQKITIDQDLKQVVVRISMDASMNHALNSGTKFWIVEPGLAGGLGGLLSGTYVGIAPGTGESASEFQGQEYPPVLSPPANGKTVLLEGKGAGSVAVGSPVEFDGMRVGSVLGTEYDVARGMAVVHAFIVQRFADRVRQTTRFWRGGGLQLTLGGGGVSMAGNTVASLLNAPIEFTTPTVLAGAPVADGTRFELYDTQGEAEAAEGGASLTYVAYFPGPVGGLMPGATVEMKGVQVGRVQDVHLRYDAASNSLQTPVTFTIDPRKLELPVSDASSPVDLRTTMNSVLGRLVQKGMRATLSTSLVLPGASGISLDMTGAPGTARLVTTTDPPIVPAAPASAGIQGALASLNDVAARIRALPIEEIASHLRSTVAGVDTLVHDPALSDSIHKLDASLTNVEKVSATARENAGPIIESLRNAAAAAESAATRANQLMGTAQYQNYDLGNLVKELTRAAESVRALASYLEQNPDALVKGRGKAK